MPETFLHGVEVVEVGTGPRPIRTARSGVVGIVGTAPNADPTAFPLNTPVLIAGNRTLAAKLDTLADGSPNGTLPAAMDGIFDQIGAVVAVIRVDEGTTAAQTQANIIGGVDANTGQYQGVHALMAAESKIGVQPRILCAPGYTHQRASNGILNITVGTGGSGYTVAGTTVTISGAGSGATAQVSAVDANGAITQITVTKPGSGYTGTPTVAISGPGTGAAATATTGTVGNPVVAEMISIAERMRAIIVADGPNTTDAAAKAYANDFGSARIYLVDPWCEVMDSTGAIVSHPSSARVAGLIAKSDNDRGFWWSPSNQPISGIVGTTRAVDFQLGNQNSRANLLNEANVATIVHEHGYRLWGNRTLSSDPKWTFLQARRTADIINDSLQQAHLWAVDRNITATYVEDVSEGVNAFLRQLKAQGAIIDGVCYPDPDLNNAASVTQGKVYFDFDFTVPYPAEHITFRSALVNSYVSEIFPSKP